MITYQAEPRPGNWKKKILYKQVNNLKKTCICFSKSAFKSIVLDYLDYLLCNNNDYNYSVICVIILFLE